MAKALQAPVQGRLFELDSPMTGKVQGERSIMDFPLFALSKKAQMDEIRYELGDVTIQIKPSAMGIATMWDKEILIYVSSAIASRMCDKAPASREVKFNTHDFFRVTGVPRPSKRDYDRFTEALARLQGTQIQTNIETGNKGTRGFFSWFSEAQAETRRMPDGSVQMEAVKVQICDWLARAITQDNRMYNYHHDYFRLGSIERRLYELAHCYCQDDEYEMSIEFLSTKIGSQASLAKLRQHLKRIEANGRLPEYEIVVQEEISETELDARGRRIRKPKTKVLFRPKTRKPDGTRTTLPVPPKVLVGS
ncbi:replication initiator protein A [Sphingomonas xinjiangensis]|uniref:Plasmid replication initiation protein n=1 Tax=Sphingomonas xinjiangensis TaxID=643568 RepID=A0A840YRD9_9SPHN|nr:replication initiator protein A [Sphingomonas xinjiangensis]MBB5712062.1 plasmid replication initiation protein [Sphingomonas xinjiangensis]